MNTFRASFLNVSDLVAISWGKALIKHNTRAISIIVLFMAGFKVSKLKGYEDILIIKYLVIGIEV